MKATRNRIQYRTIYNTKKGPVAEEWYIINDSLIQWPGVSPLNNYENVETSAYAVKVYRQTVKLNLKHDHQVCKMDLIKAWQKIQENANSCLDKEEKFLWSAHHTPDSMPRASTYMISLNSPVSPNPCQVGVVPLSR